MSLNPDGVDELILRWQRHRDERALARLLAHHKAQLDLAARAGARWGIDADDARQEAQLAFVKACDRYDGQFGASLATYARWWIRQAVGRLVSQRGAISLPINSPGFIGSVEKARRDLIAKGERPTVEALAVRLGWPVERVRNVGKMRSLPASLEAPVGKDDSALVLADIIADQDALQPDQVAEISSAGRVAAAALAEAFQALRERERQVLVGRMVEGRTLEDLAGQFGVTRERIRQLESRSLHKVRAKLMDDPRVAALGIDVTRELPRSVGWNELAGG